MFLQHFSLTAHPSPKNPRSNGQRDPRMQQALASAKFFERRANRPDLEQPAWAVFPAQALYPPACPKPLSAAYLHLTPIGQRLPAAHPHQSVKNPKWQRPHVASDLARLKQNEKLTLLLIDEAHLIDPQEPDRSEAFSYPASKKTWRLKLSSAAGAPEGHPEAHRARRLGPPNHPSLLLPALSKEQTGAYIDHRISLAGKIPKSSTPRPKDLIHDYNRGTPAKSTTWPPPA